MRILLPHAAAAAVLATAVAISMPRGLHSAPGEVLTATFHAEGAQIYHCKPDAGGKLTWQFREPQRSRRTPRGQPATIFRSCC
jgi:hypothetical protein